MGTTPKHQKIREKLGRIPAQLMTVNKKGPDGRGAAQQSGLTHLFLTSRTQVWLCTVGITMLLSDLPVFYVRDTSVHSARSRKQDVAIDCAGIRLRYMRVLRSFSINLTPLYCCPAYCPWAGILYSKLTGL